jgi:hypothetical protein
LESQQKIIWSPYLKTNLEYIEELLFSGFAVGEKDMEFREKYNKYAPLHLHQLHQHQHYQHQHHQHHRHQHYHIIIDINLTLQNNLFIIWRRKSSPSKSR